MGKIRVVTTGILAAGGIAAASFAAAEHSPEPAAPREAHPKYAADSGSQVSYVMSDGTDPVHLRSCDHWTPANANTAGCGEIDTLSDRDEVTMICWRDTTPPKGYPSPRWFYVTEGNPSSHPGWSGWVFSDLVKAQGRVPLCDSGILAAHPLAPVAPLTFAISGSCTTSSGHLTARSSGFTPGGSYTSSTGIPPSGWFYDDDSGEVRADGSVPWTLDCQGGQQNDLELSTNVIDETTNRSISIDYTIPVEHKEPAAPDTPTSPVQPAPVQQPAPVEQAKPSPPAVSHPSEPRPTTAVITVYNKVTNGAAMREDKPAYLSTVTSNYCRQNGCMVAGTDVSSGDQLMATCRTTGSRTTNGNDADPVDDQNAGLFESTQWYGVRWFDGRFGYISEVWIAPSDRGGRGLPKC